MKIWVSMLIILLIFSLISCSNGKNGINEKRKNEIIISSEIKNLLKSKYPWISRQNISSNEVSKLKKNKFIFEKAFLRNKIIHESNNKPFHDNYRYLPVLYLEILIISQNNLKREFIHPRAKLKDFIFEKYKYSFKIWNEEFDNFSPIVISISHGDYYHKIHSGNTNYNDKNDINNRIIKRGHKWSNLLSFHSFKNLPIFLQEDNFSFQNPKKEYYDTKGLVINNIDIFGNIKGTYGNENFKVTLNEVWVSKEYSNELPRDWFNYSLPKKENEKWLIKNKSKILLSAFNKERNTTTFSKDIILPFKDEYLIKKTKQNKVFSKKEIKEILEYINQKDEGFKVDLNINSWTYFLLNFDREAGHLKYMLPKEGNPKFISRIKIINHGWIIYNNRRNNE